VNGDRGTRGSGEGIDTFERWYRAHYDRLLSQCMRVLRDRAASEDVAQETLLRAWLGRERMREEDVGAWLTVVARNLCISYLRRQKKSVPTEILPETPDEAADPARLAERNESRRAVRRALRFVGEDRRSLIFRHELEGVEYAELAAELGLTSGGTRTLLFRTRRALREHLVAAGEGFAAIVARVRTRLRLVVVRGRTFMNNVERAAAPSASAGLNLVVAFGVTLATLGGGGFFGTVASAASGSVVSEMRTGAEQLGSQPLDPVGNGHYAGAPLGPGDDRPRLFKPPLPGPEANGHVYDSGDGSSDFAIGIAGHEILRYEQWREPGTDDPRFYAAEDAVFDPLCARSVAVCEQLAKQR
jgi:RNA polymerase sigma-70 factor, ECF subfamily